MKDVEAKLAEIEKRKRSLAEIKDSLEKCSIE